MDRPIRPVLAGATWRPQGGRSWVQLQTFLVPLALAVGCDSGRRPELAQPHYRADAGTVLKIDPALDRIVPSDYRIERLAGGLGSAEGPVWVAGEPSHLLFTDLRRNIIYRWTVGGKISEFLEPAFEGRTGPNGLTLDS
jgi:hypothetical protein